MTGQVPSVPYGQQRSEERFARIGESVSGLRVEHRSALGDQPRPVVNLAGREVDGRVENAPHVHRTCRQLVRPRERLEVAHDRAHPVGAIARLLEEPVDLAQRGLGDRHPRAAVLLEARELFRNPRERIDDQRLGIAEVVAHLVGELVGELDHQPVGGPACA